MRKLYTFLLFASLSISSAMAQINASGYVSDGYYRVKNLASNRYIYVTDNTDNSNLEADRPDLQAIQLWKYPARDYYSDPASVIYITRKSGGYDLQAQGTGVQKLTGYLVNVNNKAPGIYQVSVKKAGVEKTLSDKRTNNNDKGVIGTVGQGNYIYWVVDKIETNHDTNYFGIKPTIEVNGKYYQPFYAAFPFKVASPNMHVYYISKVKGSEAVMQEIEGEIPGGTPVVIECASANSSDNRLELLNSSSAKLTGNKLEGVYFCNDLRAEKSADAYKAFNASTMRLLTVKDGKLVLTNNAPNRLTTLTYWSEIEYDDVTVNCIPANTCYLKADAGTPATLDISIVGVGIDDILAENKNKAVTGVYTLTGKQLRTTNDVTGLPAGLYIVGGHKFVIK